MKAKKEAEGGGEDGVSSLDLSSSGGAGGSESTKTSSNGLLVPTGPIVLRHNQLAPKHPSDQTSILLDVDTFQALGKMQPFTVSISSSALLVLDLHSHMVNFLKIKNIFSKIKDIFSKIKYFSKFSGKGTSMRLLSRPMGSQFTQFSSHSCFSLFNSKC